MNIDILYVHRWIISLIGWLMNWFRGPPGSPQLPVESAVEAGVGWVPNGRRVVVSEETDIPRGISRPVVVLPVHLSGCPGRVCGGRGGRSRHPRHTATSVPERIWFLRKPGGLWGGPVSGGGGGVEGGGEIRRRAQALRHSEPVLIVVRRHSSPVVYSV